MHKSFKCREVQERGIENNATETLAWEGLLHLPFHQRRELRRDRRDRRVSRVRPPELSLPIEIVSSDAPCLASSFICRELNLLRV